MLNKCCHCIWNRLHFAKVLGLSAAPTASPMHSRPISRDLEQIGKGREMFEIVSNKCMLTYMCIYIYIYIYDTYIVYIVYHIYMVYIRYTIHILYILCIYIIYIVYIYILYIFVFYIFNECIALVLGWGTTGDSSRCWQNFDFSGRFHDCDGQQAYCPGAAKRLISIFWALMRLLMSLFINESFFNESLLD